MATQNRGSQNGWFPSLEQGSNLLSCFSPPGNVEFGLIRRTLVYRHNKNMSFPEGNHPSFVLSSGLILRLWKHPGTESSTWKPDVNGQITSIPFGASCGSDKVQHLAWSPALGIQHLMTGKTTSMLSWACLSVGGTPFWGWFPRSPSSALLCPFLDGRVPLLK